jgi:hypothetical protein
MLAEMVWKFAEENGLYVVVVNPGTVLGLIFNQPSTPAWPCFFASCKVYFD